MLWSQLKLDKVTLLGNYILVVTKSKRVYRASFFGDGVCPIFLTAFLKEALIFTRFSAGLAFLWSFSISWASFLSCSLVGLDISLIIEQPKRELLFIKKFRFYFCHAKWR